MQPVKILRDEERNELFLYAHGREVGPADYVKPEVVCLYCQEQRLPQFDHCHACDPDSFYEEARRMSGYERLEWLDELMINTGGEKSFCTDRGALTLEYKAQDYALDQATVVLAALGVDYNRRAGALDVTLMPGWNGRYELKR